MHLEKKQELLKQSVMANCNTCKGFGCVDCARQVEIINIYSLASIPIAYWDYTMSGFNGDKVFFDILKSYVANIKGLYLEGKSLVFAGRHGVGKTFGAITLLKIALKNDLMGYYTTMNEIIDVALSKDSGKYNFKHILLETDLLVIDEMDSRFIPSSDLGKEIFGSNLESIVRTRFQNKLPIIFCTNNSSLKEVFDGTFEQTFSSLFSNKNIITIPVGGIDLRK